MLRPLALLTAAILPWLPASATITVEAHYRMGEDGIGTNRRPLDSSGTNRHFLTDGNGATTGTTAATPAGSTAAYVFSGTNQGFRNTGWDPPEDNIGIECWARADSLTQGTAHIFGTGRPGYGNGINLVYQQNTGFRVNLGGPGWDTWLFTPYLPAAPGEWVHLAAVRDNGKLRFYVNGRQFALYSTSGPTASSEIYMAAGSNLGSQFFHGAIDEARIFTFSPGSFNPSTDLLYTPAPPPGLFNVPHPQPLFQLPISHSFYGNALDFTTMSGWQSLWTESNGYLPFGTGVTVAQVENSVPTVANYPDKTIVITPTGTTPAGDGHADTVAGILYGSGFYEDEKALFERGYSRGVTSIGSYTSGAFRPEVLKIPSFNTRGPGLPEWGATHRDVLNISNTMGNGGEDKTIRALDYLIDAENVLACTSFPGSGTYNETLSGNLWNSLVVDKNGPETKAWHGARFENVGSNFRFKPDIVATSQIGGRTGGASSWATPTVSSGAAFLLERARATPATANATHNYVLKSIIMAGAGKQHLMSPVWTDGAITGWDYNTPYIWTNTPPAMPLDRLFGAGLFHIGNSYAILNAGEGTTQKFNLPVGWHRGVNLSSARTDRFHIALGAQAAEFSVMLVWNRHIQESGTTAYTWSVADLKLELRDSAGQLVVSSDAKGNNVEHIYLPAGLAKGTYTLEVTSLTAAPENYGLAWRTADNYHPALPPYQAWANTHAIPPAAADPAADPDGDGFRNLLEYALDTEPLIPGTSPLVQGTAFFDGVEYLRLEAVKNQAATDLTYVVEVSDSLAAGSWTTAGTVIERDDAEAIIVRDGTSADAAARRFMRLRVIAN
jgi:hypothetical protein